MDGDYFNMVARVFKAAQKWFGPPKSKQGEHICEAPEDWGEICHAIFDKEAPDASCTVYCYLSYQTQ